VNRTAPPSIEGKGTGGISPNSREMLVRSLFVEARPPVAAGLVAALFFLIGGASAAIVALVVLAVASSLARIQAAA
jgi:hypothetical protein